MVVISQKGLHEKPVMFREAGDSSMVFTARPLTNSSTFNRLLLAGCKVLEHVTLLNEALMVASS